MLRFLAATCFTALAPLAAIAGTLTALAVLPAHTDGAYTSAALTQLDGKLYGVTPEGGAGQAGTLLQLDPQTGHETVLYAFTRDAGGYPAAPLTAFGGMLYGTAQTGGTANNGVVFSFDPVSGIETVLYSFPDSYPQPTAALAVSGSLLYGTALLGGANGDGYIYSIDPQSGREATVYSFPGGSKGTLPAGGLLDYNGALYGLTVAGGTASGGTLFSLNPATGEVTTLYSFSGPNILNFQVPGLTILNGVLYGTTDDDGATGNGSVYAFDLNSRKFSLTYSFAGGAHGGYPQGGLLALNGLLYGTTSGGGSTNNGTVFSLDPVAGTETILHSFNGQDGAGPASALIEVGGLLLGTTSAGGIPQYGTVFSVDPSSGDEVTLYAFLGSPTSHNSALIGFRGALYGTSTAGGSNSIGAIFKIDEHTGAATTLYSFGGAADGSLPSTPLVNIGGTLYGATMRGGPGNLGVLFSFNPFTGKLTTLANFDDATVGGFPNSLISVSGILYGTTEVGGSSGGSSDGTLFAFNPASGVLTALHTFSFSGNEPAASPTGLVAVNGTLFGTTGEGGTSHNAGTVFSFTLSSGTYATVYNFQGGADGSFPSSGLIYTNGMLFGSTSGYKKKDSATIFQVDPATGIETVLHDLPHPEQLSAMTSVGSLLFGTVLNGPNTYGSIFRFDPATRIFRTLYDFRGGTDGGDPDSALLDINGHLFGTTQSISAGSGGTIFRFDR